MKATSLLVMVLLLFSVGYGQTRASEGELAPIPGRFVVKFKASARPSAIQQALSEGRSLEPVGVGRLRGDLVAADTWQRYFVFTAKDASPTTDEVSAMLGPQNIEYIEPVYPLELFDWPTDDLVPAQWYLHNEGQAYPAVIRLDGEFNDTIGFEQGVAGEDVNISYYYEHAPDTVKKIVVAIVDTGIDPTHPELQGHLWHNPDEIEGNGLDDDHNGFVDDIIGYDISGDERVAYGEIPDNDPTDVYGHGTHCAGIVASAFDGAGIVGLAPKSEIMTVKIHPNLTSVNGSLGIVYAVNSGADIINCSWGGPFESKVLEDAIEFARANGVLVCVAAGNTGNNARSYPAAYEQSFTVGASNSQGYMTYFSTWGGHLDIVAPGQSILSLRAAGTDMYANHYEPDVHIVGEDGLYYLASGTSMASPAVAGAAAFVWSIRPHLTLEQLETDLKQGARDMIDPLNQGAWLPGADTVSGAGLVDVRSTLQLVDNGGLYFVSPENRQRYEDEVEVRVAAIGGYDGGWRLEYRVGITDPTWHLAAEGTSVPSGGLVHTFSSTLPTGEITLRLTDDYAVSRDVSMIYVSDTRCDLLTPGNGSEQKYYLEITGSLYGPEMDSAILYFRTGSSPRLWVTHFTGEYFNEFMYTYFASSYWVGPSSLILKGFFGSEVYTDSVGFTLVSVYTDGWPETAPCRRNMSPVASDLDHDGSTEIILATECGVCVYESDGRTRSGFPVSYGQEWHGIPAVYDIDRDGRDEIICTSSDGLHVFNDDGTAVEGWPATFSILETPGIGYPSPSVTLLDAAEDSVITLMNGMGFIMAFNFDGTPYRYSSEGVLATLPFGDRIPFAYSMSGAVGVDLNGDGVNECLGWQSMKGSNGKVAVYDAVTGEPAWGRTSPMLLDCRAVANLVLGDVNGDGRPEIVVVGENVGQSSCLWVMDGNGNSLPGWPRVLHEVDQYLTCSPLLVDLDMDGSPEILAAFSEWDIAILYAFRTDGTPYVDLPGLPEGQAVRAAATFSSPLAADITGDEHYEVIVRSGYLYPGTGKEYVHVFDHTLAQVTGWPLPTPADPTRVATTYNVPLVQDIDGDGLVEMVVEAADNTICVWDLDAGARRGANRGRMLADNCNSSLWRGTESVVIPCCEGYVGDVNLRGGDEPTPSDISLLVDHLYINLVGLPCLTEADANLSGQGNPTYDDITIGDINAIIDHLYIRQEPLPLCP